MVYYSVDFLKYDIRYFRSRLCLRTATESLPVRRERIPRRPRYATNLKFEWDDGRRDSFLAVLRRCGGNHLDKDRLGADLYQLGDKCLAVDGHGLFVFTPDRANGR